MLTRGSKTFFLVIFFAVIVAVVFTYWNSVVRKNFDFFLNESDIPTYLEILSGSAQLIQGHVQ